MQFSSWSTWDVSCLNAVMKVPELVELRIALFDRKSKVLVDEMRWESVEQFGPHSVDGSYFEITLRHGSILFRIEFSGWGECFVYKVTPIDTKPTTRFFVSGLLRWNAAGRIENTGQSLLIRAGGSNYKIDGLGEQDRQTAINALHPGILMDGTKPFYLRCNHALDEKEMDSLLSQKKTAWLESCVSGEGVLEDAPEAIIKGIAWNTIYEPIKKRVCTPVTREWCIIKPERPWFGAYVLFAWDTCFAGILSGMQDENLAYQQIFSLLQEFSKGTIPLASSEVSKFDERSQPPVGLTQF